MNVKEVDLHHFLAKCGGTEAAAAVRAQLDTPQEQLFTPKSKQTRKSSAPATATRRVQPKLIVVENTGRYKFLRRLLYFVGALYLVSGNGIAGALLILAAAYLSKS